MPFRMSARGEKFFSLSSSMPAFLGKMEDAAKESATVATEKSRTTYTRWLGSRPYAPPRASRPTTQGQLATMIQWTVAEDGLIRFDKASLDEQAPYWIIQEIGSGEEARILNPPGEVSVRSQRGRELPAGQFFWGFAGGVPQEHGGLGQLYPFSAGSLGRVNSNGGNYNMAWHPYSEVKGIIKREIKGKHFVQQGGIAGLDIYREQAVTAFTHLFE